MDDTFALWLTVIMFSIMTVGVTFILTNRIVELRHRVNKLEIYRRLDEDEKFWEKTPKREWVGLDEDRVAYLADKYAPPIDPAFTKDDDYWRFYQEIELELKEKNT